MLPPAKEKGKSYMMMPGTTEQEKDSEGVHLDYRLQRLRFLVGLDNRSLFLEHSTERLMKLFIVFFVGKTNSD